MAGLSHVLLHVFRVSVLSWCIPLCGAAVEVAGRYGACERLVAGPAGWDSQSVFQALSRAHRPSDGVELGLTLPPLFELAWRLRPLR